jgi:hypothetical protein
MSQLGQWVGKVRVAFFWVCRNHAAAYELGSFELPLLILFIYYMRYTNIEFIYNIILVKISKKVATKLLFI